MNRRGPVFFLKASLWMVVFQMISAEPAAAALLLPRDPARTVDLTTFTGKTYLQAVLQTNDGIYVKTITDYSNTVTISTPAQMIADFGTFASKVTNNLYGYFKDRQSGFESVAGNVAGQSLSPQTLPVVLAPFLTTNNTQGLPYEVKTTASELMLLTSGSGTVVEMSPDNYFYNIDYQPQKTSSGRTYAVASTRSLLDPSDSDYLTELGNYLTAAGSQEVSNFYTATFNLLTASDPSGVSALSSTGQVVTTDFLGIYTAELLRHEMVSLVVTNDSWETDIAEVTLVSAYITASGKVIQDGKLVANSPKAYSSNGSIGTHEADFIKLATLITACESARGHHKAMITAINKLTPIKGKLITQTVKGDVFRRALVYLDEPQFEKGAGTHAAAITSAMVQLLNQIRTDQAAITTYVLAHQ